MLAAGRGGCEGRASVASTTCKSKQLGRRGEELTRVIRRVGPNDGDVVDEPVTREAGDWRQQGRSRRRGLALEVDTGSMRGALRPGVGQTLGAAWAWIGRPSTVGGGMQSVGRAWSAAVACLRSMATRAVLRSMETKTAEGERKDQGCELTAFVTTARCSLNALRAQRDPARLGSAIGIPLSAFLQIAVRGGSGDGNGPGWVSTEPTNSRPRSRVCGRSKAAKGYEGVYRE